MKKALDRKKELKKQTEDLEVKKDNSNEKLEENMKTLKKELKELHMDVKFVKEVLMSRKF